MTRRCRVAGLADLEKGSLLRVDPDGVPICLARLDDGSVHAVSDICSHEYVELSDGDLDGEEIECPAHGARFHVATGEVSGLPAKDPIRPYPVVVENDDIYLEM